MTLDEILLVAGDAETFFYLAHVFKKLIDPQDMILVKKLQKKDADLDEIKAAVKAAKK